MILIYSACLSVLVDIKDKMTDYLELYSSIKADLNQRILMCFYFLTLMLYFTYDSHSFLSEKNLNVSILCLRERLQSVCVLPVLIPVQLKYLAGGIRRLSTIEHIQAGLEGCHSGVML